MNGLPLQPTDALLVVGGYGRVGRVVSARLGRRFPGRVVAAGRRLERAEALAAEEEGRVVPRRLDLADGDALPPALDGVRLVVLGIEGPNERVARACFERGVHLVDVTATYRLMEAVERHDALARSRGATGVLSVGLAPGLTNLLAHRAAQALDAVERVDLTVLLGLGERHGADALRWVLDTASRPFTLQTPEGPIVARSPAGRTASTSRTSTSCAARSAPAGSRRGCASTPPSSPGSSPCWHGRARCGGRTASMPAASPPC
jgi:hypothetical protein